MVKINNNLPTIKPAESEMLHGDFSGFPGNLATPQGREVISTESNKSMTTGPKGLQDTNTELLIKSLNTQLEESDKPKVYYNPKELSVD